MMQCRPISELLQRYSCRTARNRVRPNTAITRWAWRAEHALQAEMDAIPYMRQPWRVFGGLLLSPAVWQPQPVVVADGRIVRTGLSSPFHSIARTSAS